MQNNLNKIAVLGSGTMGSQIAAHFSNAGIPSLLFDIDENTVQKGIDTLTKLKPAPLYNPKNIQLIEGCTYDKDITKLNQVDLVIEAVAENINIKHSVYEMILPQLKENVILTSNTSGIPLTDLTKVLPKELRKNFLITHFLILPGTCAC